MAAELDIPFKILLIQHEAHIANLIEEELTSTGFSVQIERNGNSAVESAENSLPDLIVLEMELPRLPGTFLVRKIRKVEVLINTPIIGLTHQTDQGLVKQLLALNVKHLIRKPVAPGKLLQLAETYYKVKVIADITRAE